MMKQFHTFIQFYILAILLIITHSCVESPKGPDLSQIQMQPLEIKRYDQDLFRLDLDNLAASLDTLARDYSFFLGNEYKDTLNLLRLYNFLNDPMINGLRDETAMVFPDLNGLKISLAASFTFLKYYYPDFEPPVIYTYISGLYYEFPVEYFDSVLIIALDLYLGEEFEPYRGVGLPMYMTRRMAPQYIVPDCMKQFAVASFPDDLPQKTLLDQMILHGKILYFLDLVMPAAPDSLKIGYTGRQLEWCSGHGSSTWALMIEDEVLYSSDPFIINQFILDGPFTKGLPPESPGMLGRWTGWQIIRAYMDHHPGTTVQELFALKDSQKILSDSKYKPGR